MFHSSQSVIHDSLFGKRQNIILGHLVLSLRILFAWGDEWGSQLRLKDILCSFVMLTGTWYWRERNVNGKKLMLLLLSLNVNPATKILSYTSGMVIFVYLITIVEFCLLFSCRAVKLSKGKLYNHLCWIFGAKSATIMKYKRREFLFFDWLN